MKKILLALIALTISGSMAIAQTNSDHRTLNTRVADLLAQLPAKDSAQLTVNMKEIAAMGKDGLVEIAGMLVAPGTGDNSNPQFALNSFSYYATQPGKESWRQISEQAYCLALERVTNKENKAFIISQLQIVGQNDKVVTCLQPYLKDEQLCDPAARSLIKINTPAASNALLQAAQNAQGTCLLSVVEALGDIRNTAAVPVITPLLNKGDKVLTKVALYALAAIADPSSASILAKAAREKGFTYDQTNATDSYLLYISRLAENGNGKLSAELTKSLLKEANQDEQVHTRIAAMKLFAGMQGDKTTSFLIDAAGDKNREYRAAALKLAANNLTPETAALWVKKLKKAEPTIQAEIITMLGDNKAEAALPAMLDALKNKNSGVRIAAITAAGKTGQEKVLDELLNVMKNGTAEEVAAVENAINVMKGKNVVDKVATAVPGMPSNAKAALITVLGTRAAADKVTIVFPLIKSEDTTVRAAALSSLPEMVTQNDLPALFSSLMETSKPKEVQALQEAIIAAPGDMANRSQQAIVVLQQMAKAPADKKAAFFNILAAIGGNQSLEEVAGAFDKGDASAKLAALNALIAWTDSSAATELYRIAKANRNNDYGDAALKGYIGSINKGSYPNAQKVLMLRKAMDIAGTDSVKQQILKEVAKNKTFPALIFAGRYLDDPTLQQQAAHTVMNIALSDEKFYGNVVKELLNRTLQVLQGQDSDYQKEAIRKFLSEMPQEDGLVPLFNGKDLSGWKGLVANPIVRAKMNADTLAKEQEKANEIMRKGWYAKDGILNFSGEGENICTVKKYGDFEMFVDWKITKDGDAGIYLRGTPQVQIWDTARTDVGAQVGSGGLYNNQTHPSKPLKLADNAIGDWNNFHITMKGDRVTVYLNGELVVDNVVLENYWDRNQPIFPEEQIELQAHGTHVAYRDIYIREIPRPEPFTLSEAEKKEGFKVLFDGTNMYNWTGNTASYVIEDGNMVIHPEKGSGGNLYTKDEYGDFIFRFEFQLTPGANNGLGIRAPLEGDAAYAGMELQILDNEADMYKNLHPYQYHGSVYGVIPAKRGYLKPVGEWNYEEVIVKGPKIKVILNGSVITDGDITEARKNGAMDGKDHPGLKRDKGHIGFLGHGSVVKFRNIRVKDLNASK